MPKTHNNPLDTLQFFQARLKAEEVTNALAQKMIVVFRSQRKFLRLIEPKNLPILLYNSNNSSKENHIFYNNILFSGFFAGNRDAAQQYIYYTMYVMYKNASCAQIRSRLQVFTTIFLVVQLLQLTRSLARELGGGGGHRQIVQFRPLEMDATLNSLSLFCTKRSVANATAR